MCNNDGTMFIYVSLQMCKQIKFNHFSEYRLIKDKHQKRIHRGANTLRPELSVRRAFKPLFHDETPILCLQIFACGDLTN